MRRFATVTPALIVFCVTALVMIAAPRAVRQVVTAKTSAEIRLARQTLEQDDILERINSAVRAVSDSVMPSVVHIDVRTSSGFRSRGATGSGWVYDADGHIVTNAHVVRDAQDLRVEFSDGRQRAAELVGADAFTDIAVLKVDDPNTLFGAMRATGVRLESGDRVFSFGSPFGFKFSMSEGIVSGLGRNPRTPSLSGGGRQGFTNYIQHDAAVNPGNSGGPLVDVRGRVIGMNVAIATGGDQGGTATEGQSAGISFAIPLGVIESVVDQLIDGGEVNRGFLGITTANNRGSSVPIEDDQGVYLGRGVLVGGVRDDLAADRAGVREGDIITDIAGVATPEFHNLASVVSSAMPGEHVSIRVWRDGRFLELGPVSLAEFQEGELSINAVDDALRRVGVLLSRAGGAEIDQIGDDSLAYSAGLRAGDRVEKVNGRRVRSALDLSGALSREQFLVGQPVELEVRRRDGSSATITLRTPF